MFPPGQPGLSPIDPDVGVPGLPDWQVIPTPGHTPGHLALFREADRALIPGNAVLTVNLNSPGDALSQRHTLGGPPRFATWNWRAATELYLSWPGWSRACWRRATEDRWLARGVVPGCGLWASNSTTPPALAARGHKLTERVFNFFDYSRRAS